MAALREFCAIDSVTPAFGDVAYHAMQCSWLQMSPPQHHTVIMSDSQETIEQNFSNVAILYLGYDDYATALHKGNMALLHSPL